MLSDGRVSRLDAAMAAGVTEDVIRSWHYRGWLDAAGERRTLSVHDGCYLIDEVLEAERDTRRKSGRSHRRLAPPEVAA